ncbi:hypothetical protein Abr02nite_53680 [Paractinoplanes brasiliensis]|nr:hypothetical protein Abr02nite_53680 [Actinoplanes brasiliensis]
MAPAGGCGVYGAEIDNVLKCSPARAGAAGGGEAACPPCGPVADGAAAFVSAASSEPVEQEATATVMPTTATAAQKRQPLALLESFFVITASTMSLASRDRLAPVVGTSL